MTKKYELLVNDTVSTQDGDTLYRIRALKSFGKINKGDLGGYIQGESNLSHYGNCWVSDEARVFGTALVTENALVCDNANVFGNARVYNDALVFGDAHVSGNAKIYGSAEVSDEAIVFNNAKVYGNAKVSGYSSISDNAQVFDSASVHGDVRVSDDAQVYGYSVVDLYADICGNALVSSSNSYMSFRSMFNIHQWFTYTRSNKMWKAGDFYGTGEELVAHFSEGNESLGKFYKAHVNLVSELETLRAFR